MLSAVKIPALLLLLSLQHPVVIASCVIVRPKGTSVLRVYELHARSHSCYKRCERIQYSLDIDSRVIDNLLMNHVFLQSANMLIANLYLVNEDRNT